MLALQDEVEAESRVSQSYFFVISHTSHVKTEIETKHANPISLQSLVQFHARVFHHASP